MTDLRKIERVLISVSDKTGIVSFARSLAVLGVQIISTGGTAMTLRDNGLTVTDVAEITGFPEMMDGRVKTLHPKIHGGLLALRDNENHAASLAEHEIKPIDLIVVNLYPFEQTIKKQGVTLDEAVENIDIGGPAMIRSASKNWRDVAVVTDPRLYQGIVEELTVNDGSLLITTRKRLAVLAFTRTAAYDLTISSYLAGQLSDDDLEFLEPLNPMGGSTLIQPDREQGNEAAEHYLPENISLDLEKIADLRYGENPHQKAALYSNDDAKGIPRVQQLQGKAMSFNNYVDADAAWHLVNDFDELSVAIIKHTNPSGVGIGTTNEKAYRRALSTDPVSAFGGIVAFNRRVDAEAARAVIEVFSEVIIAPDYEPEALEIFRSKKNLRVIVQPKNAKSNVSDQLEYKQIGGGFLVQEPDMHDLTCENLTFVSKRKPTEAEIRSMLFAWTVCKHVKSNAIVLANETQTLGVGSGQMNRVDSIRIAAMRADRIALSLSGAALASDAFFPFRDNVDEAAKMGIGAIIQPGGSLRDEASIAAADENGIAMAFTGIRHFKH